MSAAMGVGGAAAETVHRPSWWCPVCLRVWVGGRACSCNAAPTDINRPPHVRGGPVLVQLERRKGWRLPLHTKRVVRPNLFGNPFKVGEPGPGGAVWTPATAVAALAALIADPAQTLYPDAGEIERSLAGFDLGCYCAARQPCHRTLLHAIAAGGAP